MLKIIKSEAEYLTMLGEFHQLMLRQPAENSAESDKLETLAVLIKDYENRNFSFPLPDPIEAIKFRMEHQGLK